MKRTLKAGRRSWPGIALAIVGLLPPQSPQASIEGRVRDAANGAPIAGAAVVLSDLDRWVTTDAEGFYRLSEVPAGPQHLLVRQIGYGQRTLHALVPPSGTIEIDVALTPEPVRIDTIAVRPRLELRGSEVEEETSFPDRGLSVAAVRNHPQLAEPDVLRALGGGEVALMPEAAEGIHVRGGASDHTAYVLDGVPVLSPYHAAGVFGAWNPDAIGRIDLSAVAPSALLPDALSGVVEASTRAPGSRFRTLGAVSSTQARLTLDGPIGTDGFGYLLSYRRSFPSLFAPGNEASYLRGDTEDWLAKLEGPAGRGWFRALIYDSRNRIDVSAVAGAAEGSEEASARNEFGWVSRSVGAEWERPTGIGTLALRGWRALSDADAHWLAEGTTWTEVDADRTDLGIAATLERGDGPGRSLVGVRLERTRTSYTVERPFGGAEPASLWSRTPALTLFGSLHRPTGERVSVDLSSSLLLAEGGVYLSPRLGSEYRIGERVTLSGGYSRLYQFAQSLRNPESVAGAIFPAELYIGSGAPGVPVARSDQVVLGGEYRPRAGVRLGAQAYARALDGLALVAPRGGEPFSSGEFEAGEGSVVGLALDVTVSGTRFGVLASYGWQRVLFEYSDSSYVPSHGASHLFDLGLIAFPTATASFRLGATGSLGRRATEVASAFEWESCNLRDTGCEFGGSPTTAGSELGGLRLPAYVSVDLGVRKHWHVEIAGRDALLEAHATVSNLFGRANVLTWARDPETGGRVPVTMRPFAPLVVGIDWRF